MSTNLKSITLTIPLLILTGCVGAYRVVPEDSRFTTSDKHFIGTEGNRLTRKTIPGGTSLTDDGIYMNPYVARTSTGDLLEVGFDLVNISESSSNYGNSLLFGVIQSTTFNADGTAIPASIVSAGANGGGPISYNSVSKSASSDETEFAHLILSKEDFEKNSPCTGSLLSDNRISAFDGDRGF